MCRQGHPVVGSNVRWYTSQGKRYPRCRQCHNVLSREDQTRRRLAKGIVPRIAVGEAGPSRSPTDAVVTIVEGFVARINAIADARARVLLGDALAILRPLVREGSELADPPMIPTDAD